MKAMVFAAGLGTRLREISKTTPKCLVEVGGVPMLERVLRRLAAAGVTDAVVNVHHLREQVERFLSTVSLPLTVHTSPEEKLLGTGGGLKHAWPLLQATEPFFIHNADVYSDIDLRALWQAHQPDSLATVAVMRRETSRALLFSGEGALVGWENGDGKSDRVPASPMQVERLAFSGIQIVSPRINEYLARDTGDFSIITSYMHGAKAGEMVRSFRMDAAAWVDIGTPEKLEALRREVAGKRGGAV